MKITIFSQSISVNGWHSRDEQVFVTEYEKTIWKICTEFHNFRIRLVVLFRIPRKARHLMLRTVA